MSTTTLDEKTDEKVDTVEVDSPAEVSERLREREERKAEKKADKEHKRESRKNRVTRFTLLRDKLGGGPRQGLWGVPQFVWSGGLRALVLLFDYVLVMTVATGLLPSVAMWLHTQSGAASGQLTLPGMLALWVLPLLFVGTVITVAAIVVMRGVWRWSGRRIEAMKAKHPTEDEKVGASTPAATEKTTGTQSSGSKKKRNRKRSK